MENEAKAQCNTFHYEDTLLAWELSMEQLLIFISVAFLLYQSLLSDVLIKNCIICCLLKQFRPLEQV